MKLHLHWSLMAFLFLKANAQQQWQPAPLNIPTKWTASVTPENALPEYPRPQLVRSQWQNLNGLWLYTVTPKEADLPSLYDSTILVPFAIESALSGVKKALLPEQRLWYKRSFSTGKAGKDKRVILHFGAVDWQTTVYVNKKNVGSHTGGFDSFDLDITSALQPGENELVVSVWDPTDTGPNMHGKQTLRPRWIRYTAVSGIWQTVWLETLPATAISNLELTPDIDKGNLAINATINGNVDGYTLNAISGSNKASGKPGEAFLLPVPGARLWSPDDPYLYDLSVQLLYKGKVIDTVHSYFGMRKIEIKKDQSGISRIFLNNKFTYNTGVLDQGYWPDGLYTAPTDEALRFDVAAIKSMGFNTIRKHIKIEPDRWYYHCDKLGMLVWQDMPSWRQARPLPDEAKQNFKAETKIHLEQLYNHPSIISWVLFNENWGSFDQVKLTKWMKEQDPSRLINGHSGPFTEQTWENGDITDIHLYPFPAMPPYEDGKAMVCGEFGGVFVPIDGHEWIPGKGWGHETPPGATFLERYRQMVAHLQLYKNEGLSGSIFTEPFDVEIEENGLITYDREVFKVPADSIRMINAALK
ncbi:MAG TPA: glycoside hydrolase family 2 TIM barrel-domain containing protein [Chitinophaga sp.]|uniref:glycoside hydrolase family 2 protein n=1 Tax=Chitinophaga sp. TaxID=1869181 RepID=UPI002BAEF537|nr:sugar-binding domain-containing protein [Chitinophaga sp.]HVI47821.1 glycoside hydrolase family 2 TIM barrel-domain containing protein [Chitinophaga sp.]